MKPKPSDHEILTALHRSRPSADPAFVQTLKQKLFNQAEDVLRGPNVSRLTLILIAMRRYSFAYVGALVLVAFGTMLLLPKGLDPEEFLAHASEQYEEQEGIFHEERLSQRFENDVVVEASLEEVWMDEKGNFLHTVRNPDTKEIVQVSMDTVDENGEGFSYQSASLINGETEMDEWDKTFKGPKYYCAKIEHSEDTTYKAILKIAEEDFSVYTVEGESGPFPEEAEVEDMNTTERLLSENTPVSVVKEILESLDDSVAYEEGDYFVFEWGANAYDGDGIHERGVFTYFDIETYELEKQKLTFGDEPNRYDLTTYLVHEYLPVTEEEAIFDPTKYDLVESRMISTGTPDYVQENGCYFEGEKLSEEEQNNLLGSIPPEALTEWEETLQAVVAGSESIPFESIPSERGLEEVSMEEISVEVDLPDGWSFIKPTEGTITQGFTAGHYAYDIANTDKPSILAVASGTVVEVGTPGVWNGGYGNYLVIDHGDGFMTKYAHCEEVYMALGDTVTQGQEVAKMGNTGRVYGATGIALHFELIYNGAKVNPAIMEVW